MDRMMLYDIIYALAAKDGRQAALFGNCAPAAREAFSRSLAGEAFPELWFETPLAGDPWLDFHALASHEDVAGTTPCFSGQGGTYADALAWFSAQQPGTVRQLALSYDTHAGDVDNPAVQLLVGGFNIAVPLGFLEAVGRSDALGAYRTFIESMPPEWYACYVGAFPSRQAADESPWVRVECIVRDALQQAYADDTATLRQHLGRIGVEGVGEDAIEGICEFARSPFPLELQFNMGPDGRALPVVSASVRFQPSDWTQEERRAEIDHLAARVQDRGLNDGRWNQLAGATFAKRLTRESESITFSCFPAFMKVRWQHDRPACAKAYLLASVNTNGSGVRRASPA